MPPGLRSSDRERSGRRPGTRQDCATTYFANHRESAVPEQPREWLVDLSSMDKAYRNTVHLDIADRKVYGEHVDGVRCTPYPAKEKCYGRKAKCSGDWSVYRNRLGHHQGAAFQRIPRVWQRSKRS